MNERIPEPPQEDFVGCDEIGQVARELVYVYRAGDIIKVGYTTNIWGREYGLSSGWTGGARPWGYRTLGGRMIACWPGDRGDERRAHEALDESYIQGEWFHYDDRAKAYIAEQVAAARKKRPARRRRSA
jgi:hypothetical protein